MASGRDYLEFVMEQLSGLDGVRYRPMMGEYIIYYQDKVIGGIYDDRFLVKQTAAARRMMPDAPAELPYEGGSEMLLVEEMDNPEFLHVLFDEMYPELPAQKQRRKKSE